MNFARFFLLTTLLSILISCGGGKKTTPKDLAPSIGQAYVGPTALNIREDLNPKSQTVASMKHGEKLDIIENRRRFVKVRTQQGVVGWTDTHQLLMPDQMSDLDKLAADAKAMHPEGVATVFEALNMHADPSRTSPGFEQLKEGTKVEVLAHRIAPRVPLPPAPILAPVPKPKQVRRRAKDKEKGTNAMAPPMPSAPIPPRNWVEMSKRNEDDAPAATVPVRASEPKKPVQMEDWYLIRTKEGKAGWVLSRMVSMAIPDEVAQYAEGHRITSYASLGKVDDEGTVKDNWLWTTMNRGAEPYEFDSFRVFVWSRRHHRYETAYVQRNVMGHYPVEVHPGGDSPSFVLLVDGVDGVRYRKTYMFNGYRVNLVSSEPYREGGRDGASSGNAVAQTDNPAAQGSWYVRVKQRISKFFNR